MTILKDLRINKGISQKELAKHLKIAQNTLSYWEQGKFEPDSKALNNLADYFNVSIDYLLGREEKKETNPLDKELEGIDFALFGEVKELTDAQKRDVIKFAKFLKQQDQQE